MVWDVATSNQAPAKKKIMTRTKGVAVGRSRIPSSSGENGICGTTSVRNGIKNKIITGNPTAAVRVHVSPGEVLIFSYQPTDSLRDRKSRAECGELQRDV